MSNGRFNGRYRGHIRHIIAMCRRSSRRGLRPDSESDTPSRWSQWRLIKINRHRRPSAQRALALVALHLGMGIGLGLVIGRLRSSDPLSLHFISLILLLHGCIQRLKLPHLLGVIYMLTRCPRLAIVTRTRVHMHMPLPLSPIRILTLCRKCTARPGSLTNCSEGHRRLVDRTSPLGLCHDICTNGPKIQHTTPLMVVPRHPRCLCTPVAHRVIAREPLGLFPPGVIHLRLERQARSSCTSLYESRPARWTAD